MDVDYSCVPSNFLCDGWNDCGDMEDESGCRKHLPIQLVASSLLCLFLQNGQVGRFCCRSLFDTSLCCVDGNAVVMSLCSVDGAVVLMVLCSIWLAICIFYLSVE